MTVPPNSKWKMLGRHYAQHEGWVVLDGPAVPRDGMEIELHPVEVADRLAEALERIAALDKPDVTNFRQAFWLAAGCAREALAFYYDKGTNDG